jgi:oligo-1,6-glucosidase
MNPGEKGGWWKEGVVYQIYPRSFNDSNGDGIGDIPGITAKLDYLADLGVDIIWLSPVYESPNFDNGYDISDYRNIMSDFGTLEDWEALLWEIHARGMRLIMDLVVNHTSSLHPWFTEARKDRENPFRNYYIWEPPRDGGPPCNWESYFEGPAWEYEEATGEYYLHLFAPEQPDLNWDNPRVRREVYEIMRFWLDKGIDGFRMDVINLISKDRRFPAVPPSPGFGPDGLGSGEAYFINGPRVHEYLREMNRQVLHGRDVMTVGETPRVTTEDALLYCGKERNELDMVFHFEHVDIDQGEEGYWSSRDLHLPEFKKIIAKWQTAFYDRGWNSNYLNNHDQPRSVSRFGDEGKYRRESAKLLGLLNFTLSGTPYIYQGEELGMTNVRFDSIDRYRDVAALRYYEKAKRYGKTETEIMEAVHFRCRDNARTPMQWSAGTNAGFSTGEPWIGVNPNYTEINAAAELLDPNSVLSFYKELVRFRREHPALIYGKFELLEPEHPRLFAYVKEYGGGKTRGAERLLTLMNFSSEELQLPAHITELVSDTEGKHKAGPLLSNYAATPADGAPDRNTPYFLRPWEAGVWELG